ncbi:hypothetical protein PIB30_096643 [Stylosanthes scabra]|uniref:RNase H type-1 domain-containing protein n=1 Tax=Stylosanthes scabra TaxID=79078 RepID=A0ABU6WUA4_9FABA|nr:hypothetical protein [Stylosanthes scabra]
MTESDLCPRCGLEPETLDHCFRFCPKVKIIWRSLGFGLSDTDSHLTLPCWLRLIQREANSVADSMAKEAAMAQHDYLEWIVPQPSLVSLIRMDSSVLP